MAAPLGFEISPVWQGADFASIANEFDKLLTTKGVEAMTEDEIVELIVKEFGFKAEDIKPAMKQEARIQELMRKHGVSRLQAIAGIVLQDGFRYE